MRLLEAAFIGWLVLVGMAATLPLRRMLPAWGALALCFPLGLCAYLTGSTLLLAVGVPYSVPVVVGLTTVPVAAAAARWAPRHELVAAREVPAALVAVAAGIGLSLAFQAINATQLTPDSVRYVLLASLIGDGALVSDLPSWDVRTRHVIVPLLHAPAAGSRLYLTSITPVIGVAAVGLFVHLVDRCLRPYASWRWRATLTAAALVFLLSTNRVLYNVFYLNGHLLFALLVLLIAVACYLVAAESEPLWVVPACLAVAVLVWLRPEAFLVAALLLVPAVISEAIPPGVRWSLTATYVAATAVLTIGILGDVPLRTGAIETVGVWVVALGLVALVLAGEFAPVRRHIRWVPHLVVAVLVLAAAVGALLRPDVLVATAEATWANVKWAGRWRWTWLSAPFLVLTALIVARLRHHEVWWLPVIGFFPLWLLFAFLRGSPYRLGAGDSGARMLLHILLLLVAYAVVAAGSSRPRSADDPSEEPASPLAAELG